MINYSGNILFSTVFTQTKAQDKEANNIEKLQVYIIEKQSTKNFMETGEEISEIDTFRWKFLLKFNKLSRSISFAPLLYGLRSHQLHLISSNLAIWRFWNWKQKDWKRGTEASKQW